MQTPPPHPETLYFTEVLLHHSSRKNEVYQVALQSLAVEALCSMLLFRHGVSRYFISENPWNAFSSMRVLSLWTLIVMRFRDQYCIHPMPLNTFECSPVDVLSFFIKGQMWYFNEV